jgi:hypothetical protein
MTAPELADHVDEAPVLRPKRLPRVDAPGEGRRRLKKGWYRTHVPDPASSPMHAKGQASPRCSPIRTPRVLQVTARALAGVRRIMATPGMEPLTRIGKIHVVLNVPNRLRGFLQIINESAHEGNGRACIFRSARELALDCEQSRASSIAHAAEAEAFDLVAIRQRKHEAFGNLRNAIWSKVPQVVIDLIAADVANEGPAVAEQLRKLNQIGERELALAGVVELGEESAANDVGEGEQRDEAQAPGPANDAGDAAANDVGEGAQHDEPAAPGPANDADVGEDVGEDAQRDEPPVPEGGPLSDDAIEGGPEMVDEAAEIAAAAEELRALAQPPSAAGAAREAEIAHVLAELTQEAEAAHEARVREAQRRSPGRQLDRWRPKSDVDCEKRELRAAAERIVDAEAAADLAHAQATGEILVPVAATSAALALVPKPTYQPAPLFVPEPEYVPERPRPSATAAAAAPPRDPLAPPGVLEGAILELLRQHPEVEAEMNVPLEAFAWTFAQIVRREEVPLGSALFGIEQAANTPDRKGRTFRDFAVACARTGDGARKPVNVIRRILRRAERGETAATWWAAANGRGPPAR